MRYSVFILIFIFLFSFYSKTEAQLNPLSTTQISVDVLPESPKPNESVKVTVSSFATNVNGATITWLVNGKVQKSGVGETVFFFKVGDIGSKNQLTVTVKTVSGEVITKIINLSPVAVDLVWQSESFVPPFYKGKAMFSHQNSLTIVATPHILGPGGREISPTNLVYSWKKDGNAEEAASGYGRNTFTFEGSIISRPVMVEVSVIYPATGESGYSHTTITPTEPSIIFYKKSPLYGIELQKALVGDSDLNNASEIDVVAIPLFFGVTNAGATELLYKWKINGAPITSSSNSNSQIFRKKEGAVGQSKISLSIENVEKLLQSASGNFYLKFDNPKN